MKDSLPHISFLLRTRPDRVTKICLVVSSIYGNELYVITFNLVSHLLLFGLSSGILLSM